MADVGVNIPQKITKNKVLLSRPPSSHSKVRKKILSSYTSQLSSKVAKNLYIEVPDENSVKRDFKPRPPLVGVKASRTTRVNFRNGEDQIKIDSEETDSPQCFTHMFDGRQLMRQEKTENTKGRRRIQSAKPRLTSDKSPQDDFSAFVKAIRPASAVNIGSSSQQILDSCLKISTSENNLTDSQNKDQKLSGLEPCVFGYKSQSFLCDHIEKTAANESCHCRNHNTVKSGQLVDSSNVATSSGMRTRTLPDDDDVSLTDLIDYDDLDEEAIDENENSSIPRTLRPLLPWLTPQVPQEWIGVDPGQCLVFLPSLMTQTEHLPCVPKAQKASDELPYKEKILPPPKPKRPKKYDHPWTKLPIEEPQCCHHVHRAHGDDQTDTPRVSLYSKDGVLLHESYTGQRTADVVRKEIQELEDLMKGIGTANGCSLVVQYQAEINELQDMVDATMGRVEEIERREELKRRLAEPTDHFGLRAFYRRHDVVIEQIQRQHARCVQELARLTEELQMNTARSHFEKRLSLMEGPTDGQG